MSVGAVILNYNDAEAAIEAVDRIKKFKVFKNIILVDNSSSDNSAEILREYICALNKSDMAHEDESRYIFLETEKNGGYGYGNNAGVSYAYKALGLTHAVIANPDSVFGEKLIEDMLQVFELEKHAGAIGAVMAEDKNELNYSEFTASCWPLRNKLKYMLYAGPVLKRIFSGHLNYRKDYFEKGLSRMHTDGTGYIRADAVHGSLLMVDTGRFMECGGYDEQVFLYCEEDILASRLKNSGYKTFCMLTEGYSHAGSHSITGSGNGAIRRQRFRQSSERYYMKHYLHAGVFLGFLFRIEQQLILFETWILEKTGFMR